MSTTITGRLLIDGALATGELQIAEGRIAAIELDRDASGEPGPVIAPGLIDLHVHGFGGCDPLDDLGGMAGALARAGTTGFQPTLFPRDPERLGRDAESVARQAEALEAAARSASNAARAPSGARVVGLHLEGPFLNPRAAGAIPPEDLVEPSVQGLRSILGPSSGDGRRIRTMTIAPEVAHDADLVRELERCGVRASLGHSLAGARVARAALAHGARGVTHLFNAMGPLHHREVGLAGIALVEDVVFAEIIGDLVHVGRDALELALRARGPRGLCLVSDALKGAGTGCAAFHWHGRDHEIHGRTAFYPAREPGAEPQLAGSACSQLEMVRTLVGEGVVGLADALTMASAAPAAALGLGNELGLLAPGARADLIELTGAELTLTACWVAGERIELVPAG